MSRYFEKIIQFICRLNYEIVAQNAEIRQNLERESHNVEISECWYTAVATNKEKNDSYLMEKKPLLFYSLVLLSVWDFRGHSSCVNMLSGPAYRFFFHNSALRAFHSTPNVSEGLFFLQKWFSYKLSVELKLGLHTNYHIPVTTVFQTPLSGFVCICVPFLHALVMITCA